MHLASGSHTHFSWTLVTIPPMRKLILLAIIGFSCSKNSDQSKEVAEHIVDTVYSTAFIHDPTYERLTVRMSDTSELNNINFRVGQKDFLKISAPRFEEYPISIRNEVNVVIDEQDSIRGIFGYLK